MRFRLARLQLLVVEVHVLRARVARRDPPGVGGCVPLVDRRVELHPGICALPGGCSDLAEQLARLHRLDRLPEVRADEVPVAVVENRLHELVGHPDRVVGVLVLERVAVAPVEVHVETSLRQHPRLALLTRLAPDELVDVRVIGVEDHHLRRAAGLAARLDRPGRGVGTAHEAHRARRGAAPWSSSREDRMLERLTPAPEPPLKMVPSSTYQLRIADIESSTARMKQL